MDNIVALCGVGWSSRIYANNFLSAIAIMACVEITSSHNFLLVVVQAWHITAIMPLCPSLSWVLPKWRNVSPDVFTAPLQLSQAKYSVRFPTHRRLLAFMICDYSSETIQDVHMVTVNSNSYMIYWTMSLLTPITDVTDGQKDDIMATACTTVSVKWPLAFYSFLCLATS